MNKAITNTLKIKTPEGVVFSIHLAGPITRFMAWVVDQATISIIGTVVLIFLGFLGFLSIDFAFAISILAYFVISIGYGILLEWLWRGQTLGKRLLRLRVMDVKGLHLQFSQIVIRNLLRFVDTLPVYYMVGGLVCLFSKRAQRFGDFVANTVVVWNSKIAEPDLDQILRGKFNSFTAYPHLEGRLRQRTHPKEASIALQALIRRDELDPDARISLFQEMAEYFKNIVSFPPEVMDGISDEQYLRNIVDTLYRSKTKKVTR